MHTIRLREPWEVETEPGRVIYRRHFNCPTGLTTRDVVRLVIEQLLDGSKLSFNNQPLASDGSADWAITHWLLPRNTVQVSIESATLPAQRPFGEVRLEISERPLPPAA
jgi:hypothetical protein